MSKLYPLIGFVVSCLVLVVVLSAVGFFESRMERITREIELDTIRLNAETEFLNRKCEELRIIRDDLRQFLSAQ